MKEIKAYIKPFKLDAVKLALSEIDGLSGMSHNQVEGYGRHRGATGPLPLTGEDIQFAKYIKLEIVCAEELVDAVIKEIQHSAHTGLTGDGKIYVSNVERAIRISTGEQGEPAI